MHLSRRAMSGDSPRTWLKGAVLALAVLAVAAPAAAKTKPKPKPPTLVRGNIAALLDSAEGGTIGCLSALDATKQPRLACALVDLRSGKFGGIAAGTIWVEIKRSLLIVHREGNPTPLFAKNEPTGAVGGTFTTGKPPVTVTFQLGRRYTFSGTRVGCTLRTSGRAVTCLVRDKSYRPRAGTYGFTIGFRNVQVLRVGAGGRTKIVFSQPH